MPKSSSLDAYQISAADWRKSLRQNQRRTRIIITLFFLIFLSIGLLIDLVNYYRLYPDANWQQLLDSLSRFQFFPIVTLIMLIVATLYISVCYLFYDKLMLLGTDYHEINPATSKNSEESKLYNVVEEMKIAAGLHYMPKVFIIDADYMNAFASGYSEKSAMVAITRGLMQKLNRDELQAVMAHELSHIRHLDIKLTLTATLLTNLTLIVLDIFFYNAMYGSRRNDLEAQDNRSRNGNMIVLVLILLRYLLPVVNLILLLYLSRTRELMADAGAVELTRNNQPLASALIKINDDYQKNLKSYSASYQQTKHENVRREAYLFDPMQAGLRMSGASIADLFSTHPSLQERLKALGIERERV